MGRPGETVECWLPPERLRVEQGGARSRREQLCCSRAQTKTFPRSPRIDLRRFQQVATNERNVGADNVPTSFSRYIDTSIAEQALASTDRWHRGRLIEH